MMILMCVNLWAVVGSAVATMVIGFRYSPMLFAKPWMVAMATTLRQSQIAEMQKSAGPKYGISFMASILSAFILGKIIYHLAISTALYGMKVDSRCGSPL
jgi:hypothetical protein